MMLNTVFLDSIGVLDMMVVIVLLTAIIVALLTLEISLQLKKMKARIAEETGVQPIRKTTWFDLFRRKGIAMDKFVEGHSYDGIQEYDNSPPAWFNWLFYGSVFVAICYMLNYHVFKTGDLQLAEYDKQLKEAAPILAKAQEKAIFLADQPRLSDDASLIKGKSVFMTNCISCHGDKGQGIVGPNLTDAYWLHGGKYPDIFKTIFNGVPDKGMLSWKKTLQPEEIRAVASYIYTLKGTNPAGAKAAQGVNEKGENADKAATPKDSSATASK